MLIQEYMNEIKGGRRYEVIERIPTEGVKLQDCIWAGRGVVEGEGEKFTSRNFQNS